MKYSARYCKNSLKINILYLTAALMFFISAAFSLTMGSVSISFYDMINALRGATSSANEMIFMYVRLPRTLGALTVGAALSVSGAVIQNVLHNRLASPGIIGVNSGAGLALTLCTAFGLYGGWELSFFSFFGAFLAVMLINSGIARWGTTAGTVILLGVALNSILNAFSDIIITLNPDIAIMSNDFKIGDFSAVTYQKLIPAMIITVITLLILFTLSKELDLFGFGEDNATGIGINIKLMQPIFLTLAAILAGSAVSLAGLVSFVGLIVPHIVRQSGATLGKHLLPLCALFGAGFVCICDLLARTVFSPYEVPVGIIMAFLGAPFFAFILIKGGHRNA